MKTAREWAKDLWSCCAADVMGDRFDEDKATTIMAACQADARKAALEEAAAIVDAEADRHVQGEAESRGVGDEDSAVYHSCCARGVRPLSEMIRARVSR